MRACLFCFSDSGAKLAEKLCIMLELKKNCIHSHIPDNIGILFAEQEALIFIGACGIAPAVQINGTVYPKMSVDQVSPLIEKYKNGGAA